MGLQKSNDYRENPLSIRETRPNGNRSHADFESDFETFFFQGRIQIYSLKIEEK